MKCAVSGKILNPVKATYNLEQLQEALQHAYQGSTVVVFFCSQTGKAITYSEESTISPTKNNLFIQLMNRKQMGKMPSQSK